MLKRLAVFSLPILILIFMSFPPLLTLTKGEEIVLETIPVDPSDVFRGDYISLNYKISDVDESVLDKNLINYFNDDRTSVKVYSSLVKGTEGYYKVSNVSLEKPPKGIYLKGNLYKYKMYEEYKSGVNDKEFNENYEPPFKYVYNIDYNIDKFFVPENSGTEFEKASTKGNLLAIVKVFKGNALLRDVVMKK